MIKNLSGEYETVEYDSKKNVMLYDNTDFEAYPVHWHDAIELIMPLKNEYIVNVSGVDIHIPENEILVIPPCELHSMPAVHGRRLIFQCDNAILGNIKSFEPIIRHLTSALLINQSYSRELHRLAKKIMLDIYELYFSKSELSDIKIYSELIQLLIAVREFQLEQNKITLSIDDEKSMEYNKRFDAVFSYIDTNYMYDISLDQLADVAGYSKYHFSRIFRQYNSMSYLQYINARRIKTAEILLLDPKIPVTEVAMRSGFKSLTTFNRIFKEIKHCTPTDFKKLYRQDEALKGIL